MCPPARRRGRETRRALELDAADRRGGGVRDVDHARADGGLHLQIGVVGMEDRGIDRRAAAVDRRLQSAFIAPRPLRGEAPTGLLRGEVEPAALEAAPGRGIGEQVVAHAKIHIELRGPGGVGDRIRVGICRAWHHRDRRSSVESCPALSMVLCSREYRSPAVADRRGVKSNVTWPNRPSVSAPTLGLRDSRAAAPPA